MTCLPLHPDVNGNDGDLNYNTGLVSNTSKFTTDLDIGYGNVGAFVRATGFIDFENENGERARIPLSDESKDRVGTVLEVLDAYVTGAFDIGNTAVDLRLGRQVLNWGESTFIPSGISAFNRFDVSKLRLSGDPVSYAGKLWEWGRSWSRVRTAHASPQCRPCQLPSAWIRSLSTATPAGYRSRFPDHTARLRPRARRLWPVGIRATLPRRRVERHRVRFLRRQLSRTVTGPLCTHRHPGGASRQGSLHSGRSLHPLPPLPGH